MPDRQCNMDATIGISTLNFNGLMNSRRNWNLANDVELLKCLEKLSQTVVRHASSTLSSMDTLEDSLNETFLRVRTVANEFQALADRQFIENRVQEEDEVFMLAEDNKEDFEMEDSPEVNKARLLESIKICRNVLSKKFNAAQVNNEDVKDEIPNTSPVMLAPREVSSTRPLPHLVDDEHFKLEETLIKPVEEDRCSPTGDLSKNSAESDIDETDRSENLLGWLPNNQQQDIFAIPRSLHNEILAKASSMKKPTFQSAFHEESESSILASSVLVDAAKTSSASSDSASNHSGSDMIEDKKISPIKEKPSPTQPVHSLPRDELLAGRNILSFKEDLSRVLSNRRPFKKQGSYESDASKENDPSTPEHTINTAVSNIPEVVKRESPELTLPLPKNQPSILSENLDSVTFPSVAAPSLESLSKTRAKVTSKRRPPSRKHRRSAVIDEDSNAMFSEDIISSISESTRSEDVSNPESSPTNPGSNILSPVTDEEDLFVLPGFDLPVDPPANRLFLVDSLLSPGTSIDDGSSPSDQPSNRKLVVESKSSAKMNKKTSSSVIQEKSILEEEDSTDGDDFPSSSSKVTTTKEDPFTFENTKKAIEKVDLFSDTSVMKNSLTNKYDLFSAEDDFPSSPPLFSDWSMPSRTAKGRTPIAQPSQTWDPFASDDLGEDLFRSTSKRDSNTTTVKTEKLPEKSAISTEVDPVKKNPPKHYGNMFDDDPVDPSNIFSASSSFMGLSLPKRNVKVSSLFESDDEQDDESLFKSLSKPSSKPSAKMSQKTGEISSKKPSKANEKSSEVLNDPLMSMARQE